MRIRETLALALILLAYPVNALRAEDQPAIIVVQRFTPDDESVDPKHVWDEFESVFRDLPVGGIVLRTEPAEREALSLLERGHATAALVQISMLVKPTRFVVRRTAIHVGNARSLGSMRTRTHIFSQVPGTISRERDERTRMNLYRLIVAYAVLIRMPRNDPRRPRLARILRAELERTPAGTIPANSPCRAVLRAALDEIAGDGRGDAAAGDQVRCI